MNKIVRKVAVIAGAAALSVGVMGATTAPAHAAHAEKSHSAKVKVAKHSVMRDSSWPC